MTEKSWLDYLWIIREHWFLALLVALTTAGFYIYKESQTIPLYKSMAIMVFEPQKERVLNIDNAGGRTNPGTASLILKGHLTDLRSNSFRSRVIDSFTPDERELLLRDYKTPGSNEDPSLHGIIAGGNKISQVGGNLFKFEFHHRNPQAAALLANRFSEEFLNFITERSRKTNESALRFLRRQSEELKLKVERAEMAVQNYRQERNLVSLEESQNLIVDRMKNLSGRLNEANVQLLNLSATLETIEGTDMDLDELAKLPAINQMGSLPQKFERRNSLLGERSSMKLRYGKRHPKMVENEAALEQLETDIRESIKKNVSDFRKQHEEMRMRVGKLEEALAEAEKEALELDQVAIEYNVLRRKLDTNKRLFTQVHQRLNEALLSSQLNETNMRLIDRAWPASKPFLPDENKMYSMAVFIFLACFGTVPYAIHFLNLNLKTAADIEQQLQVPFLGEIRKFPRRLKELHNVVLKQLDPQASELFRQLHSQILLRNKVLQPGHTFIITSALPKEGKSFLAINLAASFSRHHYKTLLMDCDFRRPSVGGRMKEDLDKIRKEHGDNGEPLPYAENFDILPACKTTVEATEWIESNEFRTELRRLQDGYDIVIIDTPPSGLFPDAGLIGKYGHHFLFLTQINKHRKSALKAIMLRLEQSNAQVLGLIVNKVSRTKSRNLGVYRYSDYGKYKSYYPSKAS
ncbi:MAG: hypothetical protein GVY10_01670 [Verrucomicrobia bacterium]|nr:hypothetical protein [Verrucomicrobiota bacterium]